jgi:SAM-dependent methyltransferase
MPERSTMGAFWDARAREDPYYFIDNRRDYGDPDTDSFWAGGVSDLDKILALLEVEITPDDVALDIGCGVGRLTRVVAGRAQHAYGIDVSAEMIDRARQLNPQLSNVEWLVGDGTTLQPLADGQISACISHVVFQHIPDPQITLGYVREIGRVLRPGGWAAFQISNDPRIHRPRPTGLRGRLSAARGRGPKGQGDPAWVGSSVTLDELHAAAHEGSLDLERIEGAGTQYCMVLGRRR